MTEMSVKEKAAGEAAKQNDTVQILNDSDPFDNPVSAVLADEGNGVKSFTKANGDKFLLARLVWCLFPLVRVRRTPKRFAVLWKW